MGSSYSGASSDAHVAPSALTYHGERDGHTDAGGLEDVALPVFRTHGLGHSLRPQRNLLHVECEKVSPQGRR